jgi:hypothetical protein
MPTNRHAATGTCEIGRTRHKRVEQSMQEFFCLGAEFFARASRNGYATVAGSIVERLARWLSARC